MCTLGCTGPLTFLTLAWPATLGVPAACAAADFVADGVAARAAQVTALAPPDPPPEARPLEPAPPPVNAPA